MASTCGFGKIKDLRVTSLCVKGKEVIDCKRNVKFNNMKALGNIFTRCNLTVKKDLNVCGNIVALGNIIGNVFNVVGNCILDDDGDTMVCANPDNTVTMDAGGARFAKLDSSGNWYQGTNLVSVGGRSFAHGHSDVPGRIVATGEASFASGRVVTNGDTGDIISSGEGSFAQGSSVGGGNIVSSQLGSFVVWRFHLGVARQPGRP